MQRWIHLFICKSLGQSANMRERCREDNEGIFKEIVKLDSRERVRSHLSMEGESPCNPRHCEPA